MSMSSSDFPNVEGNILQSLHAIGITLAEPFNPEFHFDPRKAVWVSWKVSLGFLPEVIPRQGLPTDLELI
jgi:hypothetical protein